MLYVFQVRIKDVVSPLKYFERFIEIRREIKEEFFNFVEKFGCQLKELYFQQILPTFA